MGSPSAATGRSGPAISIVLLGLAAIAILIRFLSIAQPLGIDQSLWASAARSMSRGQHLYLDVWEQRPPGIYLTYWAAFAVFGWKVSTVAVLDVLASAFTTGALYLLASSLGGRLQGALTAAMFASFTMPALLYGHGGFLERSVSETFIVTCVVMAAMGAARYRRTRSLAAAAAIGFFVGAAISFKPNAAVYGPALLSWALLPSARERAGLRTWVSPALAAGAGVLIFPVAVIVWLGATGALAEARTAVVDFNRWYVTAGFTVRDYAVAFARAIGFRLKTEPLWAAGVAGSIAALVDASRRRASPAATLAVWWGAAGAMVIMVNGIRLYNSYFIQVLPPLALAAGSWFSQIPGASRLRRVLIGASAAVIAVVLIRTGYVSRVSNDVTADWRVLSGRTSEAEYLDLFGGYNNQRGYSARANAALAEYIRSHSSPEDRVFLFGISGAGVYFLADRLPAHRFLRVNFFVPTGFPDPRFTLESVTAELMERRPFYVVFERLHSTVDPAVAESVDSLTTRAAIQSLMAGYQFEEQIEDFTLYRRK